MTLADGGEEELHKKGAEGVFFDVEGNVLYKRGDGGERGGSRWRLRVVLL